MTQKTQAELIEAARKEAQEALRVAAAMKRITAQDNPYVQVWETMLAGLDALAREPGLWTEIERMRHLADVESAKKDDALARIAALEAELAALKQWATGADYTIDEQVERINALEADLDGKDLRIEALNIGVAEYERRMTALDDELERTRDEVYATHKILCAALGHEYGPGIVSPRAMAHDLAEKLTKTEESLSERRRFGEELREAVGNRDKHIAALEAARLDADTLHLADEQTIRNVEARLAKAEGQRDRLNDLSIKRMHEIAALEAQLARVREVVAQMHQGDACFACRAALVAIAVEPASEGTK